MKNTLFAVLILMLVFPAFAPWLPHGAVHALHDHHTAHHASHNGANHHDHGHHEHRHVSHDHPAESEQAVHHPIHFDVVTYFSDYLHVDLKSPAKAALKAPVLEKQDLDYTLAAVISSMPRYELASVHSRAPPDIRRFRSDKTPLYLSTQRLRI